MDGQDQVGAIRLPSDSGIEDEDGPKFIGYVDGGETHIHEVWTFGQDGVTREVHPTARVDIGAGFYSEFATNYLTPSCLRVPMFGVNYINGSVQWLGVLAPLRTDGPPWTGNILAPSPAWGTVGTPTNPNWVSQPGNPMAVFPSCVVVLPVSYQVTTGGVRKNAQCCAPRP